MLAGIYNAWMVTVHHPQHITAEIQHVMACNACKMENLGIRQDIVDGSKDD